MKDDQIDREGWSVPLKYTIPDKKAVLSYLLLAVLLLGWCVVSGQGAYVKQAGDWDKHHAVLQDLMQRRWPVTYTYHGMEGTLTYYIAGYLLPSLLENWQDIWDLTGCERQREGYCYGPGWGYF